MAKYILREMNDVKDEGLRKVYPKMVTYLPMELDDMIRHIRMHGTPYDRGTIKGVMSTVTEAIAEWLSEGHSVKIDGLGVFSVKLRFADEKGNEMQNEEDRMGYRHVEVDTVNFRPDAEFIKEVRRKTDLERAVGGVIKIKSERFTRQERLERALDFISEHGFISLSEYAALNRMSRSVASRELRAFSQDPEIPIECQGRAPHRVWKRVRN